jgi:hypothetical protein
MHREMKTAYEVLVRKPERKRPLGDLGRIILILKCKLMVGIGGMDWIQLAQDIV